jgi:hypothetical protein
MNQAPGMTAIGSLATDSWNAVDHCGFPDEYVIP